MSEVNEPIGPIELSNETMEKIVTGGDLAGLNVEQRGQYYQAVCKSLGLNPLSKPFEYLTLNGKLRLYALRDCADQLRRLHGISIFISNRERVSDLYVVTARAKDRSGREDESTGAVTVGDLKGDALANALMKAECVPLTSEILTRNGFRFYDDLTVGEEVLAYDLEDDQCLWTPLREVTVYDVAPIINFGTQHHMFQCTPDHSWAVHKPGYQPDHRGNGSRGPRGAYRSRQPDRFLCEAIAITSQPRIVLSARAASGDHELTPAEAAILGWVMCDGTIKRRGGAVRLGICQSKPERVEEIRDLLRGSGLRHTRHDGRPTSRYFAGGYWSDCLPQTWFYLPTRESTALFAKAGISGSEDLPALVTRLSQPARAAMLAAMMAADGDARGVFGKKRKSGVMEAWQILATLEGYAVGKMGQSSVGEVPVQRLRRQRYIAGVNIQRSPAGMAAVWCPTTDYGTWVMRQHGMVTITGNTKAKRRVTLSIAGLGWLDEVEIDTIQGTSAMTARGRSVGESLKPDHPTRDQVASLIELARSCDVDLLGFGQHMRRLMELSQETKVTKKFLSESMTQGQFEEAWQHYNMRLRQLVEEEVMAELGRDGETPTPDTSGTPESMGDERTDHASLDTRESSTVDEPTSTNSTEPASAEDASASRLAPFSAEEVIYASKVTVDTVVDLAPAVGEDAVKKVQHLMAQHGGRLPQKDAEELTTEFRQRQAVKAKAAKKG